MLTRSPVDGGSLILVVEDSSDDARMTIRALTKLDTSPTIKLVRDGSEALEALVGQDACRPELIFLDLKLPKVHGFEVLRELRNNPNTREIPIVVLTSSDDPKDIAKAAELGATEYLCKPMDWTHYTRVVCQAAAKYLTSIVGVF